MADVSGFLDLRRLRYFQAIVGAGSLSGAARALHVAQPALTHHVNELEQAIGAPLLLRRHDGIEPTEAGRILDEHAGRILADVATAEQALLALGRRDAPPIRLRIGIISSLVAQITPPLVQACARELPHVSLGIIEARTRHSTEMIQSGQVDLSVHLPGSDAAVERPLAMERLYLACRGEGGVGDPVAFRDALAGPLVLPGPGNPLRSFIERAAEREGFALKVAVDIDGPSPRRQAVIAGLGNTIVGAHTIRSWEGQGEVTGHPIIDPPLTRPLLLAARKGLDSELLERLRTALSTCLRSLI